MAEDSPMGSVDKALLVLVELSAAGPRGRSLGELAGGLGVNKSTLHRTLAALRHRHFVSQDVSSGRYALGAAAVTLGARFFDVEHLPALLHPVLDRICADLDELCHLGVLDGTDVVYLDKAEPRRTIRVWSAVGRRSAAVTTAMGRSLLAAQEVNRQMLGRYAPTAQFTDEEVDRSWEAVVAARLDGYAIEQEESEPGIGCVAVAILRARRPVAAISVTMPIERLDAERTRVVGERMRTLMTEGLPEALTVPPTL